MTIEATSLRPGDPEDPATISWWGQYAEADTRTVSPYLFERSEFEAGERRVDTRCYTSQAATDAEAERLWNSVWQMACRANDIPVVGDYVEYEIAGHSILVVRDTPDTIKAFSSACRHRGRTVAEGCGTTTCFVCPFHGWSYGLDGRLLHIPAGWDFEGVPAEDYGLRPVRAEVFDGWVFVNRDPDAEPLASFLGETVMRHLLVHPSGEFWKAYHFGRVVACNWKVMVEAFLETYHIARTHPSIQPYAGDLQTQYDSFGRHSRLCTLAMVPSLLGGGTYTEGEILGKAMAAVVQDRFAADGGGGGGEPDIELPEGVTARQIGAEGVRAQAMAQGLDLSRVSDTELLDGILYLLFPNVMPFRNPAGHHAYRFRPNGSDPHSCIYEVMHLLPVPAGQERPRDTPLVMLGPDELFDDHREQMGVWGYLLDQDVSNGAGIQRGLRSLDHVVFSRQQERNILAFHHHLDQWMAGGR